MDSTDEQLAERAGRGDVDAFHRLVDRHSRRVFQVCHRITGDTHAAEDAAQEAFLSAYRALPAFESRSSFSTWLHRIAVNAALQFVRRERGWDSRRQSDPEDGEPGIARVMDEVSPGPERETASRLAGEATARALARLSSLERVAFVLRHCEQLAVREIAAQLAVTESAVKQAVLRAVRKLRVALADYEELPEHG